MGGRRRGRSTARARWQRARHNPQPVNLGFSVTPIAQEGHSSFLLTLLLFPNQQEQK